MSYRVLAIWTVCMLAACSSSPEGDDIVQHEDLRQTDEGRVDTAEVQLAADVAEVIPVAEVVLEIHDFAQPDLQEPGCSPDQGCFLDKCAENIDCQSGWCVEHMGEGVCTTLCTEECPQGWGCKQVGGGPDLVYVCVSNYANLCKPCNATADCKAIGGVDDLCIDYGDEGAFCGGACQSSDDCPWGFACQDATTIDGIGASQCVNDAGVCPCTAKSVSLSLWSACDITNEHGTCSGKRTCTEEGLGDCDAQLPMAEICNGLDENCDEDVDEPALVDGDFVNLCDDGNQCTDDKCSGEAGCINEVLDEGSCDDGNPCTVADHCVAGSCSGDPVICDDENPCTENVCTENGGCQYLPIAGDCDDEDPCTLGDHCTEGTCTGEAVACDCVTDADCSVFEDDSLCNGTLICDTTSVPFSCVVDPDTVVLCPEPVGENAFCLAQVCDPVDGQCQEVPAHEGLPCDDKNHCTIGEACLGGECAGGLAPNCNDGNICTDDECQPETGCVHNPNNVSCNDGDNCTVGDVCDDGVCGGGAPLGCDDDNPCTDDSCHSEVGCVFQSNQGPCDDGNLCTEGDQCSGGWCVPGNPPNCSDDNPCTDNSCDPGVGCVVTMNEAVCDDGDVCSTGDHCHLGQCIGAGELTCNDNNLCTDDDCNPLVGCTFAPNLAPCDDGNECTLDDTCKDGWCGAGDFNGCNDDNPCTDDWCDPAVGCSNVPNTLPCDDGDACTVDEVCAASICGGGFPLDCNDNNLCTDDSCHPATGCLNVNNTVECDDGDECTAGDTCANGFCVGPETVICDDLNQCTEDSCSPATGCVFALLDAVPCTDNSLCTDGDTCVTGQCIPGPDLVCDDLLNCTADSCVAETGCQYDPIVPCCGNGVVEPPEECDDGNDVGGDGCNSQCLLVTNLQPGDTTTVVERDGFKIQCKHWIGQQCHEVWFRVPPAAISQMAPCGIDDLDSLRPAWHGSVDDQCKTLCWIATGDSTCLWSQSNVKNGTASGWMYTASGINCDSDGRQQAEVDVPTVGKQVWSFDKVTWQRDGHFSGYQCNW